MGVCDFPAPSKELGTPRVANSCVASYPTNGALQNFLPVLKSWVPPRHPLCPPVGTSGFLPRFEEVVIPGKGEGDMATLPTWAISDFVPVLSIGDKTTSLM